MQSSSLSSQFLIFQGFRDLPSVYASLKHLSKSHPLTKIKALNSIIQELPIEIENQSRGRKEYVLQCILYENGLNDYLTTMASKLVMDLDRNIRLLSWKLLNVILNLHPDILSAFSDYEDKYINKIIANWFLSMHDVDQDIAQASRELWSKCFTPKHQMRVLIRYYSTILYHLITNFNQSVSDVMKQNKLTEVEEAEEFYSRLITMSLATLKTMIFKLSDLKVNDSQLVSLLSNKQFWKYLIIDEFPTIRAATFQLVGAVCEKAPQILEPHIKIIAPLILSCFQDQNPMVQQYIVEALLVFLKKYPSSWNFVKVWSSVFPNLFKFLSNTHTSHPSKTFNILLPFISMLSYEILGSSNEKSTYFFVEYFGSIWTGFFSKQTQEIDRPSIVKCYIESILYVLMRSEQFLCSDKSSQDIEAFQNRILPFLGKAIDTYLTYEEISDIKIFTEHFKVLISKFNSRKDKFPTLITYFWNTMKLVSDQIFNLKRDSNLNNLYLNRISSLFSELNVENNEVFESEEYYQNFGKPLMETAISNTISLDIDQASFFLDFVVIHSDSVSLSRYMALYPNFFNDIVLPIFKKFEVKSSESEPILESLCDFLSHYFEYSKNIPELEQICELSNNNSELLFHIILKCLSLFENVPYIQTIEYLVVKSVKDISLNMKTSFDYSTEVEMRLKQDMNLVRFILIDFPNVISNNSYHEVVNIFIESLDIIQNQNLYNLSSYREFVLIILELLDDIIKENHLKLFSSEDIHHISNVLFSISLLQKPQTLSFISQAYFDECIGGKIIDYSDWIDTIEEGQFLEQIHIKSRNVWKNLLLSLKSRNINDKYSKILNSIKNESLNSLKEKIKSKTSQRQIVNISFVSTMQCIDDVFNENKDPKQFNTLCIKDIILNKSLWRNLLNDFNSSVASMEINGRYFLVSNINENDKKGSVEKFISVLNFARFSTIIASYLDSLSIENLQSLFTSANSEENIWILFYIIFSSTKSILFSKKVSEVLTSLENKILKLIWSSEENEWKIIISHVIENILSESFDIDDGESLFVLRIFLQRTINWLYQTEQKESQENNKTSIKQKIDQIFDYSLKNLLFPLSFEDILNNINKTKVFSITIESFFNFQNKEKLTFISDHFNRRLVFSDLYYTQILDWYSKSISILSERTIEVVQETLVEKDNSQLCNLLQILSSLTLLNDFVTSMNDENNESRVTTQDLIQALSMFTRSMMDSYEYCNTVLWQIEKYIASMFIIIFKNLTSEEIKALLPEDEEEFISHFFQQHALVVISSFDKKESSFDQLKSRLQNFAIMEEMASSFLSKRNTTHSSIEISRLLFYIMKTFYSYEKEMRESSVQNLTFFSIIKRLQRQVCTSLISVTENIFTHLDFESGGDLTTQMISILKNSDNPYALYAASHTLHSYENISNLLKTSENEKILRSDFEELVSKCPIQMESKMTESTIIQFSNGESYRDYKQRFYAYLLSWDALTKLCVKSDKELSSIPFLSIKSKHSHDILLNIIFSFVLHSPSEMEDNFDKLLETHLKFEDISRDDPGVALSLSHEGFTLFSAQLILKLVHTFPSLVRTWFKNSVMTVGVQKALTDFISVKLSPPLVEKELKKLISKPPNDSHVKIIITKDHNIIRCLYNQDDVQLDLTLEIPPTYPLRAIEMKSNSRTGVSESKWRQVILKMTIMLFKDAGNIYDCIRLWIDNLDKHFSGWEPCPICYAVLDVASSKVPDKKCSQCKQKFHTPCLLKWFSSAPEQTCPYCRGLYTFNLHSTSSH